ncbi:MAG: hypothetical protein ISS46_04130 [Candidatus Omnitrophica bacterium]|nr:hypothetical protein [Candidatus Omnitrophota bacterium]
MKFKIVSLSDYLNGHETVKVDGKKIIRRHNGQLVIECVYCRKTGLDCDGISTCPICRGKKKFLVKEPAVMCAFCRGKGSSDTKATVCRVCHGKGLVSVEGPAGKCPECKGKGRISSTDLMCIKCGGKGVVKAKGGDYGSQY